MQKKSVCITLLFLVLAASFANDLLVEKMRLKSIIFLSEKKNYPHSSICFCCSFKQGKSRGRVDKDECACVGNDQRASVKSDMETH